MTTTISYSVEGMTCAHCVAAVTEEIEALDEVTAVQVDLRTGGQSLVTVTSAVQLPIETIRQAIDEAGYTLIA